MNNYPLVSVVVPVYNAESFLDECINSVLSQTYKNFEIILIDDGSKDSSPAICDKFAEIDSRVRVVHKKNEGASSARNDGLVMANGDYLFFLDSDDFWKNKSDLEEVINFAEKKDFNFAYVEINRSRYLPSDRQFYDLPLYPENILNTSDKNKIIEGLVSIGLFPNSPCTKLLKVSFLKENNISFIDIFPEDIPWFISILRKANEPIYYTNHYMYGNRGEVETSRSTTFSERKFLDQIEIIETEFKALDEDGNRYFTVNAINAIKSFLAYRYCILLAHSSYYKSEIAREYLKHLKRLDFLFVYDLNPKVKKAHLLRKLLGRRIASILLAKYLINRDNIKKRSK